MPLSKYNKFFGGKKGSAEETHDAMTKEYGEGKGENVFYALKNKRKKKMQYDALSAISKPKTKNWSIRTKWK